MKIVIFAVGECNKTMNMNVRTISKNTDITPILNDVYRNGEFQILGKDFWSQFSLDQIHLFMNNEALYVLPTEELIDFLDKEIGEYDAIEVGAGRGIIGHELSIRTTDSYQQSADFETHRMYELLNCPTIRYPKYVEKIDAVSAARKYRPHTILGCFVTHKWRGDTKSGNDLGIDMTKMFSFVRRFILVGNKHVHRYNPLMKLPHREIELDGLITRSFNPEMNRIFIWERKGGSL